MTSSSFKHRPGLGEERPIPNEEYYAQLIADRFKETLSAAYKPDGFRRMFHPKMHGLLKAQLDIEPDLPEALQGGIFQSGKSYPAWVRLSNAKRFPAADNKSDMRGMAVKLFDVPGKKILEGFEDANTQDFLLVTSATLQTKSVRDFQKSIYALTTGGLALIWYSLTHIQTVWRSLKQITKAANLLEESYFSTTPSLFGEGRAVKYAMIPQKPAISTMPDDPADDFLKQRLIDDLGANEYRFDFVVQFQEDPKSEPIEDPRKRWETSYQKVATLRILKQEFASEDQEAYARTLSFTPWHSIAEHRPIGGVNRARKLVYQQVATFRLEQNNQPNIEPTGLQDF